MKRGNILVKVKRVLVLFPTWENCSKHCCKEQLSFHQGMFLII